MRKLTFQAKGFDDLRERMSWLSFRLLQGLNACLVIFSVFKKGENSLTG